MTTFVSALALALGIPAPAVQPSPTGVAPTLTYVRLTENGALEYQETQIEEVPTEETYVVTVNGKNELRKRIVNKTVTRTQMKSMDKSSFEIRDLEGKKVDESVAKKTLKNGGIILMSASQEFPNSAYLKPIKAETLVVVPKPKMP